MHAGDLRTRKAVIIGAGRVGSHAALCLMFQHLVNEIVFLDVNEAAARAPGREAAADGRLARGFGGGWHATGKRMPVRGTIGRGATRPTSPQATRSPHA